jgi:predicted RND superfamily exporter protein
VILEGFAGRLVDFQIENPRKMLAILGLVTLLVIPGASMLQIKPSTEAVLPQDDPVVESLDTLRAKFGGDTTYIVIESRNDVRNHDMLQKMLRIQNRLEKQENVISTSSPASMLEQKYGKIPEDRDSLRNNSYGSLATDDYGTAVISVRSDTQANSEEIKDLYDSIHRVTGSESPGTDYYLTGYNMIDMATFSVIISDFARITFVSFAAVLLVLYGVFRDLKRMMMPMIPVMFALVWMLGLGGYLGADLTIISMVSAAMIMGLGIDFGIHVTKRYYFSVRGPEGLRETMIELSRGLLAGSTTTGVGFLSLLFANLSGMHALGIFLFTGIISAYIGAVFLLPTLITLTEPEFN